MDMKTAIIAGSAGVGLGYFLAVKRLKHVYAEMLQEEVERTRKFYEATHRASQGEDVSREKFDVSVAEAAQAMANYQGELSSEKPEKTKKSDHKPPYIISTSQYTDGETDFSQATLVYFSGDKVLTDDRHVRIKNVEIDLMVGKVNLTKFGQMADAEDVLYIRNEKLNTDFEVFLETKNYTDEVLEYPEQPKQPEGPTTYYESTVTKKADDVKKDRNAPFIISEDEFMANETDYEQNSVTWYEADGVLIDQWDSVIERIEETVGRNNLTKFGEKSGDPNIVYVRCDRFEIDFEVARSEGAYSSEVLGLSEGTAAERS